jgi:16S rRNA (cytosine1402-N4)-methyltransferase
MPSTSRSSPRSARAGSPPSAAVCTSTRRSGRRARRGDPRGLAGARLVGIDRDPEARALAARRLARFGERVEIVAGNFTLARRSSPGGGLTGLLADLGVSSLQLDRAERGFSFRGRTPRHAHGGRGETAAELVNRSTEAELTTIFRELGEEPEARRVARADLRGARRAGRSRPPTSSPSRARRQARPRPRRGGADRSRDARLPGVAHRGQSGARGARRAARSRRRAARRDGRLVVISYHSLEDRMVKHRLRDLARGEVDPVTGRTRSETRVLELLTRKPVRRPPRRSRANPRARSARLRAARRL